MTTQKIIIDTDPGIDDAMAILLAKAHPNITLLGLTTVFGNADIDTVTRNALYLKHRFHLNCDVAKGAEKPLQGLPKAPVNHIHGDDALGNIGVKSLDYGELTPCLACDYIIEQVRAYPHEITLIAIGPLTNIALALEKAPDIVDLVKDIVIMGGAFGYNGHQGNATPVAEANIYCDPLAADKVLAANWHVVVVGLDVTHEVIMSPDFFSGLKQQNDYGHFIDTIAQFYLNFYRGNGMTAGCATHDPLAVVYTIAPELFTTVSGAIRVITDGVNKGQTQLISNHKENRPAQTICTQVNSKDCLALYCHIISQSHNC